ncbi:MAG: radical SAM protein [Thermodesulfobacteriota bacterium]
MCLTIPAEVTAANNDRVTVLDGEGRSIEVEAPFLPDLRVGDWILHINNLAIRKISPEDAAEIIDLLEGGSPVNTANLGARFREAVENLHQGVFEKKDIVYLLGCGGDEKEALFKEAETIKRAYLKDFICIHGVIEFSSFCARDCLYCGLRAGNHGLKRYRMSPHEIVESALRAVEEKGYKLLVLQSGEDPFFTDNKLAEIIRRIKAEARVFIFISTGERGYGSYKLLKEAGASGVLFRFETSNKDLFKRLHPGEIFSPHDSKDPCHQKGFNTHAENPGAAKNFKNRFEHLAFFKDLGYYIATGSLTGLPGQTLDDIADDILITKKWANMVSTGPFVPSPSTPLASCPPGDPELHLKVMAVTRLVMKSARLPVVTAYETIVGESARKRALSCGANSLMINLTPERYRKQYAIYPGKTIDDEDLFVKYGLFKYKESFEMLEENMLGKFSTAPAGTED